MECLYRLNVAAIRVKIPIRDESSSIRKEYVNYYVKPLEDRDLAKRLTILRIGDAKDLGKICRNARIKMSVKLEPLWVE